MLQEEAFAEDGYEEGYAEGAEEEDCWVRGQISRFRVYHVAFSIPGQVVLLGCGR